MVVCLGIIPIFRVAMIVAVAAPMTVIVRAAMGGLRLSRCVGAVRPDPDHRPPERRDVAGQFLLERVGDVVGFGQ